MAKKDTSFQVVGVDAFWKNFILKSLSEFESPLPYFKQEVLDFLDAEEDEVEFGTITVTLNPKIKMEPVDFENLLHDFSELETTVTYNGKTLKAVGYVDGWLGVRVNEAIKGGYVDKEDVEGMFEYEIAEELLMDLTRMVKSLDDLNKFLKDGFIWVSLYDGDEGTVNVKLYPVKK